MLQLFSYYSFIFFAYIGAVSIYMLFFIQTIRLKKPTGFTIAHIALATMIFGTVPAMLGWAAKYFFGTFGFHFYISTQTILRFAIPFGLFQFQAVSLFLDSTVGNKENISLDQKTLGIVNCFLAVFLFSYILLKENIPIHPASPEIIISQLMLLILAGHIFIKLCLLLKQLWLANKGSISGIAMAQAYAVLYIPIYKVVDLVIYFSSHQSPWAAEINLVSCFIFSFVIYRVLRAVKMYRLLDIYDTVHAAKPIPIIDALDSGIIALNKVTKAEELSHIAKKFFANAFGVNEEKITFVQRPLLATQIHSLPVDNNFSPEKIIEHIVESHLFAQHSATTGEPTIAKHPMLNRHELEYNTGQSTEKTSQTLVQFMRKLNADIFIPISQDTTVLGYIILHKNSRTSGLFTHLECKEMRIFVSYLARTLKQLATNSTSIILRTQKELLDAQNKYKRFIDLQFETIQHGVNKRRTDNIGLLHYQKQLLRYVNEEAEQLLGIEIANRKHPIINQLYTLAHRALKYTPHASALIKSATGETLVVQASRPDIKESIVTISVAPATTSLALHQAKICFTETEDWFYAMSLETTKLGRQIDQLYPLNTREFINLKIQLLKLAMSEHPVALSVAHADFDPLLQILSEITLRKVIHVLDPIKLNQNAIETARELFGINPLYGTQLKPPLFEKLSADGIVVLKNVDCLDAELQQELLTFIETGTYSPVKSERILYSRIRLFMTTQQNIHDKSIAKTINSVLLAALKKYHINVPALTHMTPKHLGTIIDSVDEHDRYHYHTPRLTDEARNEIINTVPASYTELKAKITDIKKIMGTKKPLLVQATKQAYDSGTTLQHILHLGKAALREPEHLHILWDEFGSIHQIALALGVSRNTVNQHYKSTNIRKLDASITPASPAD